MKETQRQQQEEEEEEEEEEGMPVSPHSAYMASPLMSSLCVHIVFEFQQQVNPQTCRAALRDAVRRIPCFSYIMKLDEKGVLRWVKVEVDIDTHLVLPQQEQQELEDYISAVASMRLDPHRPLWQLHLLSLSHIQSQSQSVSVAVFKCHHCMGDGISLMSSLLAVAVSAQNPQCPPAFPRKVSQQVSWSQGSVGARSVAAKMRHKVAMAKNTLVDVLNFVSKITGWPCMEDTHFPTKARPGIESHPLTRSRLSLPLSDIKRIKTSVAATVNDVLSGVIFYGYQSYLQICLSAEAGKLSLDDAYARRSELPSLSTLLARSRNCRVTALTLVNTRLLDKPQMNVGKMVETEANKAVRPWGNNLSIVQTDVAVGKMKNPMDAVRKAKVLFDKKKTSLGLYCNSRIIACVSKLFGHKVTASCMYNAFGATSLSISNVVGPVDQICMAGCAVKSFSFFVTGIPQALHIHIVSYIDDVIIYVAAHQPHVDARIFAQCLEDTFESLKQGILSSVQNILE